VEGVLDLAFEADGGWTVVDFKTDAEIGVELGRLAARWGSTRRSWRERREPR
jgi:hypothetical protein